MYAVFRTGGKQFRAEPGTRLRSRRWTPRQGTPSSSTRFSSPPTATTSSVGAPTVDGASVKAEVLGHGRTKKVIVFKRKRRKGYRKKQGHRQGYTEIQVARSPSEAMAAPGSGKQGEAPWHTRKASAPAGTGATAIRSTWA
jgi:large subunit ribosomal protein L21